MTRTPSFARAARAAAIGLGAVLALGLPPRIAWAQAAVASPGGEALYKSHCASCHDNPDASRAPSRAALGAMRNQAIDYALTQGKMKAMGAGLTDDMRASLIGYLTGKTAAEARAAAARDAAWADGMMCPAGRRAVDLRAGATVADFGFDAANSRSLTARASGLTKAGLSHLQLAWAIAIPGGTTMRAQPAIVGKTVFLPVADAATMYAFDVSDPLKPCIKWLYKTPGGAPLRTSAAYGVLADGRGVLAFSGIDTTVYLLDAKTGKPLWTRKVGAYKFSLTTGTPVVLKTRVIVPVSQFEISVGGDNRATCCNNHGYVLSLDPRTGDQQWRYDTMPDAQALHDRGDGKMLYGPSGAPIWSSPLVNERRGLIYFGTGESNSPPVHRNTDAMIAIGLADGKERWSRQATDLDIFLEACGPRPKPTQYNCTANTVYRDVDFGASFVLGRLKRGVDVVYAGQKSGAVWAVQPDTGRLLWRNDLGTGSPLGGVHWGLAFDDDTVFAPISLVGHDLPGQRVNAKTIKSGMYALDASTGAIKWMFATEADCAGDRPRRMPACGRAFGLSAAPAVIDGAVVEGGLDGYLYVLDASSGKPLWKYDTATAFEGINGVAGKGGSIDAASITAGNGMLFVNSGYAMFGQVGGNVFLAFRPKGG